MIVQKMVREIIIFGDQTKNALNNRTVFSMRQPNPRKEKQRTGRIYDGRSIHFAAEFVLTVKNLPQVQRKI